MNYVWTFLAGAIAGIVGAYFFLRNNANIKNKI